MTASPALTAAPTSERTLRRVLAADALVGLVAAVGLLAATGLYARLTGLPEQVLRVVGLALIGYVAPSCGRAARARCDDERSGLSSSPTGPGSRPARSWS